MSGSKVYCPLLKTWQSLSNSAGIPVDEFHHVQLLRESIIVHHIMVKIFVDYNHDFSDLPLHTFVKLCAYLELHLLNVVSQDDATKAHGLSIQVKEKPGYEILLSMNAAQIPNYLTVQAVAKKWKNKHSNQRKKCKTNGRNPTIVATPTRNLIPHQTSNTLNNTAGVTAHNTTRIIRMQSHDGTQFNQINIITWWEH
jgi:hypothetical protein